MARVCARVRTCVRVWAGCMQFERTHFPSTEKIGITVNVSRVEMWKQSPRKEF